MKKWGKKTGGNTNFFLTALITLVFVGLLLFLFNNGQFKTINPLQTEQKFDLNCKIQINNPYLPFSNPEIKSLNCDVIKSSWLSCAGNTQSIFGQEGNVKVFVNNNQYSGDFDTGSFGRSAIVELKPSCLKSGMTMIKANIYNENSEIIGEKTISIEVGK